MYTIKEAAARTGVPIPLLRAWERRYAVVTPTRTPGGYRLYDEDALDRLRTMRALVDEGWQPSAAASAILAGTTPVAAPARATIAPAGDGPGSTSSGAASDLVGAAAALDGSAIERALDEIFAAGSFEAIADRLLLPALVSIGEAWADGRVSVAGEHAASQAVQRRLAAAFQAAGRSPSGRGAVLVGLPPGSRHELGALAFAVAARRAGLPVLYLGPDLPVIDWVATARATRARAAVVGVPTAADAEAARGVVAGLANDASGVLVAVGGHGAAALREAIGGGVGADANRGVGTSADVGGADRPGVLTLPDHLADSVTALRRALSRGRTSG